MFIFQHRVKIILSGATILLSLLGISCENNENPQPRPESLNAIATIRKSCASGENYDQESCLNAAKSLPHEEKKTIMFSYEQILAFNCVVAKKEDVERCQRDQRYVKEKCLKVGEDPHMASWTPYCTDIQKKFARFYL